MTFWNHSNKSDEKRNHQGISESKNNHKTLLKWEEMSINKMNIKQITLKASSKKEIYRMLQLEDDVELPQANHSYVADVISVKSKDEN